MPNYREGVQTPITFRVYATDGSPYTTSGTPPTLLVQKNRSGAPASSTGTLSHAGSGLWSYTPAAGEVSAPCSLLHLMWSGSGMAAGDVAIEFENDFTPTVSGRIDENISAAKTLTPAERTALAGVVKTAIEAGGSTLATLLSRIPGTVATLSDLTSQINAINQSASRRITCVVVSTWERPEAGNNTYTIEVRTFDGDGAAANATANPTLTVTGAVTGSLAANLSAISNPATGVYRWSYTVAPGHALEEIRLDVSAIMADGAFTVSSLTQTADFLAADFTATDRSRLVNIEALADALPLLAEIMAQVERAGGPLLLTQADALAAKTAAQAAQARVELALPNAASNTNNGLPIKSNLPGAAPSVAEIADGVWDEALSGHAAAGSAGKALSDGAVSSSSSFAILGMKLVADGQDCDCETLPRLNVRKGDDRDVVFWVVDGDGRYLPIPSSVTPTLVDATGGDVNSAELADIKASIGYLKIRLSIPSTGTMPTSLMLLFDGGPGATWTWEVLLTVL